MNWKPGRWVECEHTQEKGMIEPYDGKAIRISLGEGLELYATPQALDDLGWKLLKTRELGKMI